MTNNADQNYSGNFSRFLVPFYVNPACKKKTGEVFRLSDWEVMERNSIYLTRYLQEIYENGADGIGVSYRLKAQARAEAGLPEEMSGIYMLSTIKNGREDTFSFLLKDITAVFFATGIGFLVLDIIHEKAEALEKTVDKSFALSNIFTHEHDHGKKSSGLLFYYYDHGKKTFFSLKNALYSILGAERLKERMELFPTNPRKKMNVYHSIFKESRNENDEKTAEMLSKGLDSRAIEQEQNYDFLESSFAYAATKNTGWNICSNGVVSFVYDDKDNHEFLSDRYLRNVKNDYFLIYLFALHEREILLRYNFDAVKSWNKAQKLVDMKKEMIRFNIWFSYNTVSAEMSYQNFYECLYRALKLEKLENDIQEVLAKVDDYVSVYRERKLNSILSAIAVLAIFSALTDGISLVDRIYEGIPLKAGYAIVLGLIFLITSCGIYFFVRKDKK